MQIGIQLPEVERLVPWAEFRRMAVAAEQVGFASIWLGDHLLYERGDGVVGPWECWSMLAALAAVTDRVLLGPLVTPTGFRNPAMLAKMAATVDEISGGRLVLGLGSGWNRREYEAFGYPFDRRVSRFAEDFRVITELIRSGESSFAGEFVGVDRLTLDPPARADLPIMIGSTGPRMLAIAAKEMDWWNDWFANFENRADRLAPLIERLDSALAGAGRDPRDVVRSVAVYVRLPGAGERTVGRTIEPISGDTDTIVSALRGFDGLVDHLQLVVDPITLDSIERLAPVLAAIHADEE